MVEVSDGRTQTWNLRLWRKSQVLAIKMNIIHYMKSE